jgi:[glutamine synthetase] adenylyltransferase / [glutamine synthetase]-adenylyl-L-tyrosine phosphorylase
MDNAQTRLLELGTQRALELGLDPKLPALRETLGLSDFAFDLLARHPEWAPTLCYPPSAPENAEPEAVVIYRQRRALAQIALELSHQMSIEDSLSYASATACVAIESALTIAETEASARFGVALTPDAAPMRLVVFGMGKLGGHELNFSSDIDLIACYLNSGDTQTQGLPGQKSIDHQEYFSRQTRRAAQILSELTPLGSAYRVDLRLRPFGTAGQHALSFAAMEDYYQREGRDWERYAWIKAAAVAGDITQGAQLKERLRPFVYRKYLDFAAFEGLREMKLLVDQQVKRTGMADNIKLGPGGIREIEFLVQLEQLIRGGRDPRLRATGTLPAIAALTQACVFSEAESLALKENYLFLRALENRVQMLSDQQTHDVPEAPELRDRIAGSLNFDSFDELQTQLEQVRANVQLAYFKAIEPSTKSIGQSEAVQSLPEQDFAAAKLLWQNLNSPQLSEAKPEGLSDELWCALVGFVQSGAVQGMSARGRTRLDQVLPLLWSLASQQKEPEACALLLIAFLTSISGRSAYMALLAEKPAVAKRLVSWFAQSAWIARTLTQTPILLDELLDYRRNAKQQAEFTRAAIAQTFDEQLSAFKPSDNDDVEAVFELLVSLKNAAQLRVATQFFAGVLDAEPAMQALSAIADVVLAQVLKVAYAELIQSHGPLLRNSDVTTGVANPSHPREGGDPGSTKFNANTVYDSDGSSAGPLPGFCIIGYGSLGGEELNFASDLDLVFLFDRTLAAAESTGPRILDGTRFCVKLAQRVLSLLTMITRFGPLYPIDTRLRPNGNKGLLVTSLEAFGEYQKQEAWTWEHQALVRARAVAGDEALGARFSALRIAVLAQPRGAEKVRTDVTQMRARMRGELDRSSEQLFDLKQGVGGLVDIEFALQQRMLLGEIAPDLGARTADLLLADNELAHLRASHLQLLALSLRATLALKPRVVARELVGG